MRSGYVNLTVTTGTLRTTAGHAVYWSSRAVFDAAWAYSLYFNANAVYPSHDPGGRYNAFPLR